MITTIAKNSEATEPEGAASAGTTPALNPRNRNATSVTPHMISAPDTSMLATPTSPSDVHVHRVATAIMNAVGKPDGDWRRWCKHALAAISVGVDPAAYAQPESLVELAANELAEISEWARTENAALRPQEIASIAGVLKRLRGHLSDVEEGVTPSSLRWIPVDESTPQRSYPGSHFIAKSRKQFDEYVVRYPAAQEDGLAYIGIASYWGARKLDDGIHHDWYCPLTDDDTIKPSHWLDLRPVSAALAPVLISE